MKCPKCGNEVLSTDSHCSSCGVHLATAFQQKATTAKPKATPTGKVCPKCGHPVKSTDIACGYCTHYLGSSSVSTTSLPTQSSSAGDSFYQFFISLPVIFAVLVAIAGIVLSIVIEEGWIFLVGFIAAGVIWFIMRVSIAPIVTAINYLQAIEKNTRKK